MGYIHKNINFEALTKVKADHTRHIEQLWDEIKKLKEKIQLLEKLRDTECPICKMECKYCEEKESRRKFIHTMVTDKNDDNNTHKDDNNHFIKYTKNRDAN